MDPYVVLEINDIKVKTSVKSGAGKFPSWEETYSLRCKVGQTLKFAVWDEDSLKSHDLVGDGALIITDYHINTSVALWVSMTFNKMSCGELALEVCFFPDNDDYIKVVVLLAKPWGSLKIG